MRFAQSLAAAEQQLAAARAAGDVEAERAAQAEIESIHRQRRIQELHAALAAKQEEIHRRAEIDRLGQDQEVARYQHTLDRKLNALVRQLGSGKITYRQFVERVNKILNRVGVGFHPDLTAEEALRKGRRAFREGGAAMATALANGFSEAFGETKEVIRKLLKELKEMLPGSEPRDPASPLRGLAKAGEAVVRNFSDGLAAAAPIAARELSRLTTGLSMQLSAQLAVPSAIPAVNVPAAIAGSLAERPELRQYFSIETSGYGPRSDATEALSHLATLLRSRGGLT